MKRLDLKPIDENVIACLNSNLSIRHEDIRRFISLLDTVEPPFSVCIDAPWGDGKTMFVKSVQMILEARNPNTKETKIPDPQSWIDEKAMNSECCEFLPIYFNAWSNDMLANPLGSIIASMAADCEIDWKGPTASFGKKAVSVIDSFGGALGHNPNINELRKTFSGSELIEEYKSRRNLEYMIDEFIKEILKERANKIVLFIDELDRCRPEFAIQLLSDIKNLFENEQVIIVYSADLQQLANALQGFYGDTFSTARYLERFYDIRFEMTPIMKRDYFNSQSFSQVNSHWYNKIVDELLEARPATMRDINRLMLKLRDAEAFATRNRSNADWSILFAERGLLPVFIFLEHELPDTWRKVRLAESFSGIYEFGTHSPTFIKLLDNALLKIYDTNTEITDDLRIEHVESLCSLIFIDRNANDPRRIKAYQELECHFWSCLDPEPFRTFDFRKYNSNTVS